MVYGDNFGGILSELPESSLMGENKQLNINGINIDERRVEIKDGKLVINLDELKKEKKSEDK